MSKRPGTEGSHSDSKRQKIQESVVDQHAAPHPSRALLTITATVNELVDCLRTLKEQLPQEQARSELALDEVKIKISKLQHLLPSLEAIISDGRQEQNELSQEKQGASDISINTNISPSGVVIPSTVTLTPWKSSEIKRERPSLPQILNPDLAEEAFTHPGLGRKYTYERLEWLGDAYLELISTALIHQTFGQLPSGRCSQLRERLIRNVTLAEYFRHYGMQKWAKLPADFSDVRGPGRGRSCDKDLLKTQADMFEAYVAAVILSDPENGLSAVIEWLKALWAGTLEEDIRKAEATSNRAGRPTAMGDSANAAPSESSAKEQLAQRIMVKGVSLRYKDLPCEKKDKNLNLPLYSIGVYLDGWGERDRLLAVGTALKKKEAGQKAAEAVLQNKKLMKVYEEKKRAYMQAREAEMLPP